MTISTDTRDNTQVKRIQRLIDYYNVRQDKY